MKDIFNNSVGPQITSKPLKHTGVQTVLVLIAIIAGLQTATQYFAYSFNFQKILGAHFLEIYPPWAIIFWAIEWNDLYQTEIQKSVSFGVVVSSMGLIFSMIFSVIKSNSVKPNLYLHGSARWANLKDIKEAGLLSQNLSLLDQLKGKKPKPNKGVYVGAWKNKSGKTQYLRHSGPEHVLTYAPTRSGKGVGLVVPTLLSWSESAVITDLKGELWTMTAGWRKKYAKNKVIRFEPATAKGSARWNPLEEIRIRTAHEVGDVQNLATLIVDPHGKGLETHWQKTGQSILVGVILHVLYKSENEGILATLPLVDAALADPNRDIGELWMEMITYKHFDDQAHPVVSAAAKDMMDRPDDEAGSVLSTAKSYLALYRDPVVAKNVSHSDFHIKDLMFHKDPVSLYSCWRLIKYVNHAA